MLFPKVSTVGFGFSPVSILTIVFNSKVASLAGDQSAKSSLSCSKKKSGFRPINTTKASQYNILQGFCGE